MDFAFVVGGGLRQNVPLVRNAVCKSTVLSMRVIGGGRSGRPWKIGGGDGRSIFGGGGSGKNGGSSAGGDGLSGNGGGRSGGGAGDAGAGSSSNPLVALWVAYNELLVSKPILTKALTSLTGFSIGDILAQKFLNKGEPFDKERLLRMALFGFLFHGPTGHYFYGALDRLIVGTQPLKVAAKVAIDQILWAPIFTACFFTFLGVMEKKPFSEIKSKIDNDLWAGVTASWKVWPVVHAINFRFIPTSQRLLYINTIQIGYNIFLSLLGNRGKEEVDEVPK